VNPILDKMLEEQRTLGTVWSPSKMIERLGLEIKDESSIYYWAARNGIPVFSPALTDGSLGDMMYFHSYRNPGLVCDIVSGAFLSLARAYGRSVQCVTSVGGLADIRRINDMALRARHTGCIILGGGVVKHHIMNANLMRNGADHVVYVNTAQEFDGLPFLSLSRSTAPSDLVSSEQVVTAGPHQTKRSAGARSDLARRLSRSTPKHPLSSRCW
jgi:deoxyhypusine synthase